MNGRKELTKEAVLAAVETGASTMTGIVRALGYSSVCGGTMKRVRDLVPDLEERIRRNKGAKEPQAADGAASGKSESPSAGASDTVVKAKAANTAKQKPSKKDRRTECPRSEHNKFREGSAYATAFDLLAAAGNKGIERSKLVEEVARLTGKSIKKAYYDVTVVASSRQDGRSHRCIARAADSYYVDRTEGGWLKLVLRDRKF